MLLASDSANMRRGADRSRPREPRGQDRRVLRHSQGFIATCGEPASRQTLPLSPGTHSGGTLRPSVLFVDTEVPRLSCPPPRSHVSQPLGETFSRTRLLVVLVGWALSLGTSVWDLQPPGSASASGELGALEAPFLQTQNYRVS